MKLKFDENPVLGMFMKTSDPAFVEAASYSGMDFVILDMEHGPVSLTDIQNNIRAAQVSGVVPIVRVNKLCPQIISQVLDIGAYGIQIPQIQNAKEAREAIKSAKFYPDGERGVCRFVRAAGYSSVSKTDYFKLANDYSLIILQIEGVESINNLDEILKVKGIDIIFIGPYDLSQSLGIPGEVTNPKVIEAMKKIVERADKMSIKTGTFVDTFESLQLWKKAGVNYLAYSVDVGVFYEAGKGIVEEFRCN